MTGPLGTLLVPGVVSHSVSRIAIDLEAIFKNQEGFGGHSDKMSLTRPLCRGRNQMKTCSDFSLPVFVFRGGR